MLRQHFIRHSSNLCSLTGLELGGIIGGAGQLLSGLSSFGGGGDFSESDTSAAAYAGQLHGMRGRLAGARVYGEQFGYHPLAALGVPGFGSPVVGGGSSRRGRGRAIGQVAQGTGNIIQAFAAGAEKEKADKMREEKHQSDMANDFSLRQYRSSLIQRALQKEGQVGVGRAPLYQKMYDNREELGPLEEGEMFLVGPEVAEQLEGIGAVGLGLYGTGTAARKPPLDVRAYRYIRDTKYQPKKRVKRVIKRKYLPDIIIR